MSVLVDGIFYESMEEAPDMGSLMATEIGGNKMIRHYEGLLSDLSKLPHYVETGSSALLYDGAGNTKVYKFNKSTDTWYELQGRRR